MSMISPTVLFALMQLVIVGEALSLWKGSHVSYAEVQPPRPRHPFVTQLVPTGFGLCVPRFRGKQGGGLCPERARPVAAAQRVFPARPSDGSIAPQDHARNYPHGPTQAMSCKSVGHFRTERAEACHVISVPSHPQIVCCEQIRATSRAALQAKPSCWQIQATDSDGLPVEPSDTRSRPANRAPRRGAGT